MICRLECRRASVPQSVGCVCPRGFSAQTSLVRSDRDTHLQLGGETNDIRRLHRSRARSLVLLSTAGRRAYNINECTDRMHIYKWRAMFISISTQLQYDTDAFIDRDNEQKKESPANTRRPRGRSVCGANCGGFVLLHPRRLGGGW